jgi:hypothetical protein
VEIRRKGCERDPGFVDRAFGQFLNFVGRHFDELYSQRETLAHAHADELVAVAVLALTRFEVMLSLLEFRRRTDFNFLRNCSELIVGEISDCLRDKVREVACFYQAIVSLLPARVSKLP